MEVVEGDETGGNQVMLLGGVHVHGLVRVGLVGRSNYCQTTNRHSGCRGLESWLSGLHEPFSCRAYCEKGIGRQIGGGGIVSGYGNLTENQKIEMQR